MKVKRPSLLSPNGFVEVEVEKPKTDPQSNKLIEAKGKAFLLEGLLKYAVEQHQSFVEAVRPMIQRAIKVGEGGRIGHEKRYGTDEEKHKRWDDFQTFLDEKCAAHPDWNLKQLHLDAHEHFGVSTKTIQRHTVSPLKKK